MGAEFTFYDYVDETGVNVIYAWLSEIPKGVKQRFDSRIRHLEALPPGQWGTGSRLVDTLTDGACDGLFEIRVRFSKTNYRILAAHSDRQPSLLHCFEKKGAKVPQEDCIEAKLNLQAILADPVKRKVEHAYEQD